MIAAGLLQKDIEAVTGKKIPLLNSIENVKGNVIIIGTISHSDLLKQLNKKKKIVTDKLTNTWEASYVKSITSPYKNIDHALIITGSDRRGVAYGVFELSKQIGVSPWYWWADVPVIKKSDLFIDLKTDIIDAPKIKYRGIFLNDEAPALTGWAREKFGGLNHQFYEKVFELILRLKGNYLWPAMWGNAFNDDDTLNPVLADKYGIVMGTSHHEPMLRAQQEWKRYGKGKWDYNVNEEVLKDFWKKGIENMGTHESILTVGMRGDGDMPMSRETATDLLERIVKDQREIITEVTGKPADKTPQLWALYKEVQDYYDKGMRVPDDVTLLLCDDNWGNIRKLPKADAKPRRGGYGIYYHFDYVGGPRNYKWLNTNPLPRIWEQMHLAYEYNVRDIWIVNVGDLKPMEFPISFWFDYAWNPEKIGANDLQAYTEKWAADLFGNKYAKEIASILATYTKINGRKKPEMLNENTYSFYYGEWESVVTEYNDALKKAEEINSQLPAEYKDAFFQLVLHPVKACANLNEMYYYVALNKEAFKNKWEETNTSADKVKELFEKDSLITNEYHQLKNGKWNHMMDQKHIGYRSWQEPRMQTMPEVKYVPADSIQPITILDEAIPIAEHPEKTSYNLFYETNNYVSINADHFTKAVNSNGIKWQVLSDHGRTGSSITTFPVIAKEQSISNTSPHVEYEFYTYSVDSFKVNAYFSPTYNFHDTDDGLQYAISVDDETPQIISINRESKGNEGGIMYNWVANNIIIKNSAHNIHKAGKHTLKYWMIDPGIVLQKLVLDFGGVNPSYLGPPETIYSIK
ncbi:MAG: glycosyl hydrolase 115 family protein [Chitinophagales bacterium]|nr:glycosyl hydrolase 115 family protein [Chitinophagales bacterium]